MRTKDDAYDILKRFTEATEPVAEYVYVDRVLAELMIDCNIEPRKGVKGTNRRSNPATVQGHSETMLREEWLETTGGIGFNINGELVDGAHRLKGLLRASTVDPSIMVRMLICGGLPVESKRVIDTGRKRTPAQILQMEGFSDVHRLAATLRLVYCYDHVPYGFKRWEVVERFTSKQMLQMLADDEDAIVEAVRLGSRMKTHKVHMSSTAASAAYYLGRRDAPKDVVNWFNERLIDGLGLASIDPVYRLREFYKRNEDVPYTNIEHLAFWMKAMNAHLIGKTDLRLHFKKDIDKFPYLSVPADWGQDKTDND